MKRIKYTPDELEILEYMESKETNNITNVKNRIKEIKNIVIENTQKRKQISFRLLESDLEKLKTKALIEDIPYQTLLSSIVHKFLNGTLQKQKIF